MLNDPLSIVALQSTNDSDIFSGAELASFEVQDLNQTGSVRVGAVRIAGNNYPNGKLTISRSVSNENKPVKTNRLLVRLDVSTPTVDTQSKEALMSAYFVSTHPVGQYSYGERVCLVRTLAAFLLLGEKDSAGRDALIALDDLDDTQTSIRRLLNGSA